MNRVRPLRPLGPVLSAVLFLAACAGSPPGSPPRTLGPQNGDLAPCPGTPNCVHTGHGSPEGTPAWALAPVWASRAEAEGAQVMDALQEGVETLPRTRIIRREAQPDGSHYLHAEVTSRIFRFVDDLELLLKPGEGAVVVRSASRTGRSDLGVNQARISALREYLQDRGVLAR